MQIQKSLNASRPIIPLMAPPPLYFVIAFGIAVLIGTYWPVALSPVPDVLRTVGTFTIVAGLILALSLVGAFLIRRTTLNPFAEPSVFIAAGPYRFSRNPMYLSVIIIYIGATLLFGSLWPLITLAAPLLILALAVIPYEEARMTAAFGESYQRYSQRVRRWI